MTKLFLFFYSCGKLINNRKSKFAVTVYFRESFVKTSLKMKDYLTERSKPKGIDVFCGLKHFAIITYAVPKERFAGIFQNVLM